MPDRKAPNLRVHAETPGSDTAPLERTNILIPAQLLQSGEIIVLLLKPSPLFIVLSCLPTLTALVLLTAALVTAHRMYPLGLGESQIILLGIVVIVGRLFWQFMEWLSRVYVLTDRRVVRVQGVLRISIFETPLQRIQHTNLLFSIRERFCGLGTITFATAGTAFIECAWTMLANPLDVHQKVVETINRYKR
ncbi:MAG: PH domain-containing protein [Phycisphaeraceae bacterium]|nr:PH domain-containing protein [Phycisphaeraceae bacterium]